jgi:lysophospholipase L1-like esterase
MISLRAILVFYCMLMAFASHLWGEGITVHLIGDSTMAARDHSRGNPEFGWGETLQDRFVETVEVINAAAGGRSAKSFIDQGLWDRAKERIHPGDWVIIQFGHNDQKKHKPSVYAAANGEYRDLLTRYVQEVRALGASPILVSSIYRRVFRENVLVDTLGDYPASVVELAGNLEVPFIDLHAATGDAFAALGPEGTLPIFVHFEAGENEYFPEGRADNSHLSKVGSGVVSDLFVSELSKSGIGLADLLKNTNIAP